MPKRPGKHTAASLSPPPVNSNPQATLAALSGRDRTFLAGRWFSFKAALQGAWHTLLTQPNAWIELTAIAVVSVVGWWLQISPIEWALLALTFSLVLALEAVNTAIEATVDLLSPRYHPLAKIAKDAAAGALVFAVLGSLGVATAILGPRLWPLVF
jgi:diacylglycerol kinase (ATP)